MHYLPLIFLFLVTIGIFILFRNEWLYRHYSTLVDSIGTDVFKQYLTYNQMMVRFWIWDIEKLRKPVKRKGPPRPRPPRPD